MDNVRGAKRLREELCISDEPATLEIAAVSDVGNVRSENQDGWMAIPFAQTSGCALLVADGMGGHARGRESAELALRGAADVFATSTDPYLDLSQAFHAADEAVGHHQVANASGRGVSGTTLVGAVITNARLHVANVGDSRAYLARDHRLLTITHDHTILGDMVHAGEMSRQEAETLPGHNLLTRAVTGASNPPDFFELSMADGDVLMMCSDGLWGVVGEEQLLTLLSGDADVSSTAEKLCDAALGAGSRDNVTVVVCRRVVSQTLGNDPPNVA